VRVAYPRVEVSLPADAGPHAQALPIDAWYAVAHDREVGASPRSVRILGQSAVLFRSGGELAALRDRCPHRHAPLSDGVVHPDGLACPYHGWRFAPDGRCVAMPGLVDGSPDAPSRRADPLPVRVQDGLIWLSVGEPPADPPRLPLVGQSAVHTLRWRFDVRADPVDALENFLDPTHTHTVHPGLVRTEGSRRRVPVTVRGLPGGVEAVYQEEAQSGLIARWFGADIRESYGRYLWPGLAQLGYRDAEGTEKLVISASFVPASTPGEPPEVDLVAVVSGRPPRWIPGVVMGALLAPFLKRTVAQDKAILERVAPLRDPERRYAMSPLDLLRPHIDRLLADPERLTPSTPRSTRLDL